MADQQTDPHDDKVRTVPLPSDEAGGADRVIAQENQSAEVALGGGGWPSPDTPATGPAPGGPPPRIVDRPDGAAAEDGVEAAEDVEDEDDEDDEDGEFPPMREVLEADPVAGGSQSVPDDEDATDGGGAGQEGGGAGDADQRWGGSRLP